MRIRTIVFAVSALILSLILAGAGQQSAEQLYKSGLYEEEVGGDLQKAIGIYQDLLKRFPESREVAAKAQLRIGLCFEKLGTKEAERAFQQVIDNYPEQAETVRQAKDKLAILMKPRAAGGPGETEIKLRRIWSGPEVDILGSVSPDGRFLSFVDWTTGDLAVRELVTGAKRRLTSDGKMPTGSGFALFSKWSPDNRRIAYLWYNQDEIFELRVLDAERPAPRVLVRCQVKEEYIHPFDWSPDSRYVLTGFYRGGEIKAQLGLVSIEDGSVKIIKPNLVTQPIQDPGPWGFVFSPDGRYIAYDLPHEAQRQLPRDIFLLAADGSAEFPLIEHPAADTVFDWTPDGKGLLFLSDRTGTPDLWYVDIVGGRAQGSPRLIKSGVGMVDPMGITAGGAVHYGLQGNTTDVFSMSIDPQSGKVLSPPQKAALLYEGRNTDPDYSPDGKVLAYISRTGSPAGRSPRVLALFDLESGAIREFALELPSFSSPRWAPEGRALAIVGIDKEGRSGIHKVDSQTGELLPIVRTEKGTAIDNYRWSKDGKRIIYSASPRFGGSSQLFVLDLQTGQSEPLPGSPDKAQAFDISPDGKSLVFLNRDAQRVISVMPTAGGEIREIHRFEQGGNFFILPAWSRDGRYIYFSKKHDATSDMWDLYRVPSEGGEETKIGPTMGRFGHFSFHPDGRHIAFRSRGTNPEQSEVWVMENFLPISTGKK